MPRLSTLSFLRSRGRKNGAVVLQANTTISIILLILSLLTGAFSGSGAPAGGQDPTEQPPVQERPADPSNPQPPSIPPKDKVPEWAKPGVLQGKVVVLDPGHGGANRGAVGIGPTPESINVLAIAYDIKGMLEYAGAKVIMTRTSDVSPAYGEVGQLEARTILANNTNADIYVSIHNDWYPDPSITGTTTFYYGTGGQKLALAIQPELVKALGSTSRGVKFGNFYVLRNTRMPAALVEVGFVSNKREAELLSTAEYREKAARGIYYGIARYFLASDA